MKGQLTKCKYLFYLFGASPGTHLLVSASLASDVTLIHFLFMFSLCKQVPAEEPAEPPGPGRLTRSGKRRVSQLYMGWMSIGHSPVTSWQEGSGPSFHSPKASMFIVILSLYLL